VSWQDSQPLVQIDGEWFTLVSLDDMPATEIVAFSQQTYGELWQKRFEEDLVEVLAGMGHEPNDTVRLVVMPLGSSTPQTLEGVPMTAANRRAIRTAAERRASPRQLPPVVQLAPDVLEKYVGVYAISPQFALTVTLEGDQLMVQATGQQNFPVYPKTETMFEYKAVDAQLHFVANPNGAVNYLVLHQNGKNQVATRQE
jgi:hypothetical protein